MSAALVQAIDALLAFLDERRKSSAKTYGIVALTKADMPRFSELDFEVYKHAVAAGREGCLPAIGELNQSLNFPDLPRPVTLEGHVNLPGDWEKAPHGPESLFMFGVYRYRWQMKMDALRKIAEPERLAKPDEPKQKRSGRPRNGESDKDELVIAALVAHHQYESGGSVGNDEPATGRGLSKANTGLSTSAISRFFKAKFGERGHKGYESACRRRLIGRRLAEWQGDQAEGHFGLRDDDCDYRRNDD